MATVVNYALVIETYILDLMRATFIVTKARRDYLTMHRRLIHWVEAVYKLGENRLFHWLVNPRDLRRYLVDVHCCTERFA